MKNHILGMKVPCTVIGGDQNCALLELYRAFHNVLHDYKHL